MYGEIQAVAGARGGGVHDDSVGGYNVVRAECGVRWKRVFQNDV